MLSCSGLQTTSDGLANGVDCEPTMRMEVPHGKPGPGVRKELTGCAIVDHLVRRAMCPSATLQHIGVERSGLLEALRWRGALRRVTSHLMLSVDVIPQNTGGRGHYSVQIRIDWADALAVPCSSGVLIVCCRAEKQERLPTQQLTFRTLSMLGMTCPYARVIV